MSAAATRLTATLAHLQRSDGGIVAGVCAGVARAARIDPTVVRLVFALLVFARGAGILAYLGAWLALPAAHGPPPGRIRRAAGALLFVGAGALAVTALGVSGWLLWPTVLVGIGLFLALARPGLLPRESAAGRRVAAGVLIVTGGLIFVGGVADAGRWGALIGPSALALSLFLVIGPWVWQLARERDSERLERIRMQERAEMAARVHDSVLQTLALVQRSADDPRRVATLARRQERELRAWLYPDRAGDAASRGRARGDPRGSGRRGPDGRPRAR
jgi:phage shock protein PspC (stress-responsive transcriptional regulator)